MNRHLRRLVLLASPWYLAQAWRVAVVFGRRRAAMRAAACLVAYAAIVVAAGLVLPLALVPVAAAALGATALGAWHGRRAAGVRHGLPPGRVPLVNPASVVDREHFVKRAERDGPTFKAVSAALPVPTACVVGLGRASALLREHDDRLAPVMHPFDALIPGRLLRHMRGDAHRHYRRILFDTLDEGVIERARPELRAIVGDALASFASATAGPGGACDPHDWLERDVALAALVRLFLGAAPGTALAERASDLFLTLRQDMGGPLAGERLAQYESVTRELDAIVRHVAAGTVTPEPAPATFVEALLRAHPGALDDPTVLRNVVFALRTGATDLTGLLHWIMAMLAANPQWTGALRTAPDRAALADRIVMETLRLEQSELLYRFTTDEIDLGDGATVPPGWLLRVCVRESHRDPVLFPDPLRFDPTRFERSFGRTEYAPLGLAGHTCLGAGVIRAVAGTFVDLLADHELVATGGGRPVLDVHWRPSPRLLLALRPLAPAETPTRRGR